MVRRKNSTPMTEEIIEFINQILSVLEEYFQKFTIVIQHRKLERDIIVC